MPRTTTSRPKVTSPETTRRSHATSDGGPAGKRGSKSPTSLVDVRVEVDDRRLLAFGRELDT